ncbi:MAG TPA: acyltransferase [Puia sp.]|nr:acyltransferase [Puia sp.]
MPELRDRPPGQVEIVTILRGLAATSVFLFHLVCVTHGYIPGDTVHAFFSYGRFGVQFFFVISGFVIPYSMMRANYRTPDFFRFLLKRVVRIEPPYMLILVLTVAFLWLRSRTVAGDPFPVTWQQVALHVGYLIPFSGYDWLSIVFWTLAIEFQFYLFFSLAFRAFTGPGVWRWLISALLIAIHWIHPLDTQFLYWSPIFLMGIYLALGKMKKIASSEMFAALGILAVVGFLKFGPVVDLFALTSVAAIYFEPVIRSRVLDFLGNISYSLYLSHTLIAFAVINIGIRYTRSPYQRVFFVALAVTATLLFSWLLYLFVERPAKKWASAIKYK